MYVCGHLKRAWEAFMAELGKERWVGPKEEVGDKEVEEREHAHLTPYVMFHLRLAAVSLPWRE